MSETQTVFTDVKILRINGAGSVVIGREGEIEGNILSSEFHPGTGELFIVSSASEIRDKNVAPTYGLKNGVIELKIPRGFKLKVNGVSVERFHQARPLQSFRITNSKIGQLECEESVNVRINSLHIFDMQSLTVETQQTSSVHLPNTAFFKKLSIRTDNQSSVSGSKTYLGRMTGAEILSIRTECRSSVGDILATQHLACNANGSSEIAVSHFKTVDTASFSGNRGINLTVDTHLHLYEDVLPKKKKTLPLPPKKKKRTQE